MYQDLMANKVYFYTNLHNALSFVMYVNNFDNVIGACGEWTEFTPKEDIIIKQWFAMKS